MSKIIIHLITAFAAVAAVLCDSRDELFMGDRYESGFLPVGDRSDNELFYVYLPCRRNAQQDRPIILWVTGAAGCSSEFSLFSENGPVFLSSAADGSIRKTYNKNSWTEVADMLYVDQPLGVGFSDAPTDRSAKNYLSNPNYIAKEMRIFLLNFLKKYPELKGRKLYIGGESHAAQFAPSIALYLTENPLDFKLEGILLGSPWVDPISQYPAVAEFLQDRDLISPKMFEMARNAFEACTNLLREGKNTLGLVECNLSLSMLIGLLGDINPRNVKKICQDGLKPSCYDTDTIIRYLNSDLVKSQLRVTSNWNSCNPLTQFALLLNGEWRESTEKKLNQMMGRGLKVLIYIGDDDGLCNWKGIESWTSGFRGELASFKNLHPRDITMNGRTIGELLGRDQLYILRIFESGYLVPKDQPQAALEMLSEFLNGELLQNSQPRGYNDADLAYGDKNRPYFLGRVATA